MPGFLWLCIYMFSIYSLQWFLGFYWVWIYSYVTNVLGPVLAFLYWVVVPLYLFKLTLKKYLMTIVVKLVLLGSFMSRFFMKVTFEVHYLLLWLCYYMCSICCLVYFVIATPDFFALNYIMKEILRIIPKLMFEAL